MSSRALHAPLSSPEPSSGETAARSWAATSLRLAEPDCAALLEQIARSATVTSSLDGDHDVRLDVAEFNRVLRATGREPLP